MVAEKKSPKRGRPATPVDYTVEVPYPLGFDEYLLQVIAAKGEIFIFPDAGGYLKRLRERKSLPLHELQRIFKDEFKFQVSAPELMHTESGDMDSVTFNDILKYQEFVEKYRKDKEHDNQLFWEICWKSASFLDELEHFISSELGQNFRFKHREIRSIAYSLSICIDGKHCVMQ